MSRPDAELIGARLPGLVAEAERLRLEVDPRLEPGTAAVHCELRVH